MPITKRDVDTIEPKTILWDTGRGSVSGFGVRCQSVSKSFILKYNHMGRGRWYTIGRFGSPWTVEGARGEARRLLGLVAAGGDPGTDRRPSKATGKATSEGTQPLLIAELCDQYLVAARASMILTRFKKPKKASTLNINEGRIARHIKPLIGGVPVADLERHGVHRMIAAIASGETAVNEKTGSRGRAIVTGGQTTAARVADLLSGIMAWAVDMNLATTNPVHGVRRFRAQPRERFLSNDEIISLGKVFSESRQTLGSRFHPFAVQIIKILSLTGCRLGEIVNLKWTEIDFQNGCLRLQDTKTGRSTRPVGQEVLDILQQHDRLAGSPFVFPATRGNGSYQGTKRQAGPILLAAGIEGATAHTLRHTFGSVASDLGYSDATIAGLLGHAGRGVTSRYVHRPDVALRSAANAVASRISEFLQMPASEVAQHLANEGS